MQRDYRNFRLERGVVTYADQIALADELVQHPEAAAPRIRQLDFRLSFSMKRRTPTLRMFSVLHGNHASTVEADRPLVGDSATNRPAPGHFCMVGDFQQSIYRRPRRPERTISRVHDCAQGIQDSSAEALTFSVTFRLDQDASSISLTRPSRTILHGLRAAR